jgi:hypothetical protein
VTTCSMLQTKAAVNAFLGRKSGLFSELLPGPLNPHQTPASPAAGDTSRAHSRPHRHHTEKIK